MGPRGFKQMVMLTIYDAVCANLIYRPIEYFTEHAVQTGSMALGMAMLVCLPVCLSMSCWIDFHGMW